MDYNFLTSLQADPWVSSMEPLIFNVRLVYIQSNFLASICHPQPARWFRYECETSQQPIRFNFDVEFCRPILPHSQILSLHHFNLRYLHFQYLQSLSNWIQLPSSETSPVFTLFQWTNNENTLTSVTALYQASSSSSYFSVERAAKTLHRMSPCTPVSVPAKITRMCMMFWLGHLMLDYNSCMIQSFNF